MKKKTAQNNHDPITNQTFQSLNTKFMDSYKITAKSYIQIYNKPFLCIHFPWISLYPVQHHL